MSSAHSKNMPRRHVPIILAVRNYSIYSRGDYLFAYMEYVGEDYEGDMAKMAASPITQQWWDLVKPLMQPLDDRKEGEFWSDMEEIYYLA